MKSIISTLLLYLISTLSFGYQASREKPDSTDLLQINNLKGLRFIDITTEEDIFTQKGINKKPDYYQYYFRVEGEEEYTKVSYFGINLSEYIMPVNESYGIMKSYQYLKMSYSGMFLGSLVLTVVSGVTSIYKKELSPIFLLGIGIFTGSWIPRYFSHNKIPEAIGIYNTKLNEYKQKNP